MRRPGRAESVPAWFAGHGLDSGDRGFRGFEAVIDSDGAKERRQLDIRKQEERPSGGN